MKALGGRKARKQRQAAKPRLPKMTKGPLNRVPCPFCGHPNDFRDVAPGMAGAKFDGIPSGHGGSVEPGDSYHCDSCDNVFEIANVQQVTIVHARPPVGPGQ